MPFSDIFSALRHIFSAEGGASGSDLCPFQAFFLSLGIKLIFSEIAGKKVGREEVGKAGKGEKREGKKREGKKREGQKRQERERGGKAGKKAERERRGKKYLTG